MNIKDNASLLTWTLGYDGNDDQGLNIGLTKKANKNSKNAIDNYVKTKTLQKNRYWYYWKYIKDLGGDWLYFRDFTDWNCDKDTFDLIIPAKRRAIIDNIVKIVKTEMAEFQSFPKNE